MTGLITTGIIDNKIKTILSLDAGGMKGIYSIAVINGLSEKLNIKFNSSFDCYIGTSIGAVIVTMLSYGIKPNEILSEFIQFKSDLHKGHTYLINRLFLWIDKIFDNEKFAVIKPSVFIPVYNSTEKKFSFFSNKSGIGIDLRISDILKAACSDIRIIESFRIQQTNLQFADAGFFAYDPILFFTRKGIINTDNNQKILSIGSGIIENISNDLSLGDNFDIIYDAFLYDQFETTSFIFKFLMENTKLKYTRISEFLSPRIKHIALENLLLMAQRKVATITSELDEFIN